jgi:chromosomal replication initiation ATPase DnaA
MIDPDTQVEPNKIIRAIGEVFGVDKEELLRKRSRGVARSVLMEMLYRYGGMNQREIGELLGIDYSAVSVTRRRLSELQEKDRNLSAEIERVKKRINLSQE